MMRRVLESGKCSWMRKNLNSLLECRLGWVACGVALIGLAGCSNGTISDEDCTKARCTELGKNCGTIVVDGCGEVQCGNCEDPETCGGGGTPNVCGEEECKPSWECEQPLNGYEEDQCGNRRPNPVCDAPPLCGNGVKDPGEACDRTGNVGCSGATAHCRPDCSECIAQEGPILTSLVVSPPAAYVPKDGSKTFAAFPRDQLDYDMDGVDITWTTSDDAIATIDPATGQVTGKATGTVTVWASSGSEKGRATLLVIDDSSVCSHRVVRPGESIQAAIDSLCPTGGLVELVAGTYTLSSSIAVGRSNVFVVGSGTSTVLDASAGAGGFEMPHASPTCGEDWSPSSKKVRRVAFKDFKISGAAMAFNLWNVEDLALMGIDAGGCIFGIHHNCGGPGTSALARNIAIADSNMAGVEILHTTQTINLYNSVFEVVDMNRDVGSDAEPATVYVRDNVFNEPGGVNYALHLYSGTQKAWKITGNTFLSTNGAWDAIEIEYGSENSYIARNLFKGDYALRGALRVRISGGRQVNHTFANNIVIATRGDGVHATADYDASYGELNIVNNVFFVPQGDGFDIDDDGLRIIAKNNIIFGGSGYGINVTNTHPDSSFSYNDIWNMTMGPYAGIVSGQGDKNVDPLFANGNIDSFDFHLRSERGRWDPVGTKWVNDSAGSTSGLIGAGDPASDNSRSPWGGPIEIGAYGNTLQASAP